MLEWTGPWSDYSEEIFRNRDIPELTSGEGEWWMKYEDLLKYFTMIEFCHLLKGWKQVSEHSSWSWSSTFQMPFIISLSQDATLFVSLEQKGRREMRDEFDSPYTDVPIELEIYQVPDNIDPTEMTSDMCGGNLVADNGDFDQVSAVTFQGELPAGQYYVIAASPYRYEADFFIRAASTDDNLELESMFGS